MSKEIPAEVQEVIEILATNPKLQGAYLQANESQPGVWEIQAMRRVCVLCAQAIGAPSGDVTHVNHGVPGKPIVMPHACRTCGEAAHAEFGVSKGGQA